MYHPSLHSLPMSEQSQALEPERQYYAFAMALTIYSKLKKSNLKGKTSTKHEEKSVKTKKLLFALEENNYLKFLEGILKKHEKKQYKVSSKQQFSFKFIASKIKGYDAFFSFLLSHLTKVIFSQPAGDAMDVDNELDYKNMVQKIIDAASDPSSITKILVDMKNVKKLPSGNGDLEYNDSDTLDSPQVFPPSFSDQTSF